LCIAKSGFENIFEIQLLKKKFFF